MSAGIAEADAASTTVSVGIATGRLDASSTWASALTDGRAGGANTKCDVIMSVDLGSRIATYESHQPGIASVSGNKVAGSTVTSAHQYGTSGYKYLNLTA